MRSNAFHFDVASGRYCKELLKEVPACEAGAILKFLDQRARSADDEASKKSTVPGRKPFPASKAVATHLATSTLVL